MIEALPDGARRAALLLHALPAPDRQWLLSRLDARQRQRQLGLLDELETLGVQVEPSDVAALLAPRLPEAPPDWPTCLPDEPAWMHGLLVGGAAGLAPATRRTLLATAARRRPVDAPRPTEARPPGTAGGAARPWIDRMRRWLP
jgi:hypothetical protein